MGANPPPRRGPPLLTLAADRPEQLRALQALTDVALAHLQLDPLLSALLERTRDLLSADTCAVLILDEERKELVARAAVGLEEEVERGVRIPFGRGFAGTVAARRRPVVLDDVDHADVLNPLLREKGVKSMLGVPLLVGGEPIGVLHVGTLVPRRFDAGDVELLQLVAERVALAIERARVHQETVLLDELKLNFVAVASHELRTPATSVYGVLTTLAAHGDDLSDETRKELIRVGCEQGERLRRLLEELLDLSRLDAAAVAPVPRPIVLREVLGEIAAASVPGGTVVQLEVPSDLAVVADPLVLERIISNLLTNSVRYGRAPITVAAEQRDRRLRITVRDCGDGVPEDLQPHLFERFARAENAVGSGLGLAIARSYARAHGGDLIFDPTAPGARFELVVPQ